MVEPGCPEEILVYRVCILCFKVDLSHESNCPYSYIIYYIDSVIYIYIYILIVLRVNIVLRYIEMYYYVQNEVSD